MREVFAAGSDPIIGVHGLGVSTRHLRPLLEALARHRGVVAPDLPGFGGSDRPARALGVEALTAFVDAWLDAVGLGRAPLWGNSLGCQILVELAVNRPERVGPLVLVGPTFDPGAPGLARQGLRLLADSMREPPALDWVVVSDYLRAGPLRTVATARRGLEHPMEARLARVRVPTLVVRGERDPIVSQEWAERAAALLPFGRLAVIPGAPHAAHFAAPERVLDAMLAFLDEDGRRTRGGDE